MKQIKDPLTCSKCGHVDQNDDSVIPHHCGTSVRMRCVDCAGVYGKATLCRKCCPSEHGTKFPTELSEKNLSFVQHYGNPKQSIKDTLNEKTP